MIPTEKSATDCSRDLINPEYTEKLIEVLGLLNTIIRALSGLCCYGPDNDSVKLIDLYPTDVFSTHVKDALEAIDLDISDTYDKFTVLRAILIGDYCVDFEALLREYQLRKQS